VRIPAEGTVSLPVVGEVQAEGYRPEEFRQQLICAYSKYIRKPDITLLVGEKQPKKFTPAKNSLMLP